ncbi:hypothetical protein VB711_19645 [Cronbergia sp. UHCC 0137]|uniref:hypothetical protein n=1 Tax=Cronbergia sp. UHCC 0137 TaxID=3110239 RepID=UPI002B1F7B78|nr:hypothetical protein [Cronbergia sp. UHCC 0137]MEA5620042.1 hypothetical protein [Cronbergia sp. UHCC 0137]
MSYVSLLKNIPEALSQPTGIAAIASLGIHGAIALIVPLMPVDSNKPKQVDTSQAVGLIELSQADQSRLPQPPNTNQVALPQPKLPLQSELPPLNLPGQSTLPLLQPPSPSQQILPPLPPSANQYTLSYLPRRQSIEKYTRENFRAEISDFKAKSSFSPANSPFIDAPRASIQETPPLDINKLPQVQADNQIIGEPLQNPSPEVIDVTPTTTQRFSDGQQTQINDNTIPIAQNPQSLPLTEQPLVTQERLALALAKKSVSSPKAATEQLPTDNQSPTKSTEQLLAHLNSYSSLRKDIQQEYPNAQEQGVIREIVSTEKAGLEGNVLGRLVVDADGKVLEIKFQDRSISPELQAKAREFFNANPPKGIKQATTSYPFHLQFKHSSRSSSNSSNSASELKPVATPESSRVSEPIKLKPVPTPESSRVSEPTKLKPVPTPESSRVSEPIKLKPVPTPESSRVSEPTKLKPVPTPESSRVSEPETPNNTQTELSANESSSSNETAQKLIQHLNEIKAKKLNSQTEQ